MPVIVVNMNDTTVMDLSNSGFFLYGFKAVQGSDKAARPLIWFRTSKYSIRTQVNWEIGEYGVYSSFSKIQRNKEVVIADQKDISLGQTATVGDQALITVKPDGVKSSLSIEDSVAQQFTCGIMEQSNFNDSLEQYNAFPLLGQGALQVLSPLEKVLLMFSTDMIEPGTVIVTLAEMSLLSSVLADKLNRSISARAAILPGFFIDLSNEDRIDVSYDVLEGWTGSGQTVSANANLVPLLIES